MAAAQDGYFEMTMPPPVVAADGRVQARAQATYTGGSPTYHQLPQSRTLLHGKQRLEGPFEFALLNADRTPSEDGSGVYTDEGHETFFRPGDTVSGMIFLPRNSRQGLAPGDYWVRASLTYVLADEPAEQLWLRPRYTLVLDVPFTIP